MAKSRKPVSTFDLTGIAYDVIEKDRELATTEQEDVPTTKEPVVEHSPAKTLKTSRHKVENERSICPKLTGVRLYDDQIETFRRIEFQEKRRNIVSETVRIALDEYFERHHYV